MAKQRNELNAENLKQTLWETLVAVRAKKIDVTIANSVATGAREIMRVVNAEIRIAEMTGTPLRGFLQGTPKKELNEKRKARAK
jgi:hypothetical protein